MDCIAKEVINQMKLRINTSLDQLVIDVLDGNFSYSERIGDYIYYTFKDNSLLCIKEKTGEVQYKAYSETEVDSVVEVFDFLLENPPEPNTNLVKAAENYNKTLEENEEFCTLDVDLDVDTKIQLVSNFFHEKLNKSSLKFLKNQGVTNGVVLYHGILNEGLYLGSEFQYPDEIILEYLKNNLSYASLSLLNEEYELSDQLFNLILNEQILLALITYIDKEKINDKVKITEEK